MQMCTIGHHIIPPGTEGVVVREGVRYCPEHVPPEPDTEPEREPTPETLPYVWTARQRRRIDFQRHRYEHGAMDRDDYWEPPNELDRRLAKHVLP